VNLSAAHFARQGLPESIQAKLEETGLPASSLKLEVTESVLMENTELAASAMQSLRALGVRFGLDDFGTGYSSLSYLHRFPFETLKIDRSFIRDLGSSGSRPELASAIVLLAGSMSMTVVAEGVETPAQLAFLKQRGCGYVQGFLYSPAVPEEDAMRLFVEQPFLESRRSSADHQPAA
jgi:EAL domain-containing protein (putative c-di-GMP-specific phosphodiesterase class I)